MHYEGDIYRPPSDAKSIILQVTTGCSYNRCRFCAAYKNKKFSIKDEEIIFGDLRYAACHFGDNNRLFLCDGDALIIPQKRFLGILAAIRTHLPKVQRIGCYANAKSLARKTSEELAALRENGLTMIHLGLESGDDVTLRAIDKWGSADDIVEQGIKVRESHIKLFVTVILGLAGVERSIEHAEKTGAALSRMNPPYVGALSLMPVEGTPLHDDLLSGKFRLGNPRQILEELRCLLAHTDLRPGQFYANHASNYLPLRVRLPHDKPAALSIIDSALCGDIPLTPEWLRGL